MIRTLGQPSNHWNHVLCCGIGCARKIPMILQQDIGKSFFANWWMNHFVNSFWSNDSLCVPNGMNEWHLFTRGEIACEQKWKSKKLRQIMSVSMVGKHKSQNGSLVALHRAMRLRFGYRFESCDANGPRNVKNTNIAKHKPIFFPPLLLVGNKELVLKMPKRGQFYSVTRKRCDSCAQVALGTRTVSRRNFWDAESLAKRCGETCH